jgi:hypothetical protein
MAYIVWHFRSREALCLENLALRHQLAVYQQTLRRPRLHPTDCLFWSWLSRLWPNWQDVLKFVQPRKPPSPTWKAFLKNHVQDIVALDFFTVLTYKVLFVFVILAHERHLKRVLNSYVDYYHHWRTHLSLDMDCPEPRAVEPPEAGAVIAVPELGGLHHHDERRAE